MKRDEANGAFGTREFSRRQVLGFVGSAAAAAALSACGAGQSGGRFGGSSAGGAATTVAGGIEGGTTQAAAAPSCMLVPEATEGPYYLDLTRKSAKTSPRASRACRCACGRPW